MELSYLQIRLAAAVAAAKAATHPGARIAHEGMAKAYRALLVSGARVRSGITRASSQKERHEMDDALDEWDNEGGGSKEP